MIACNKMRKSTNVKLNCIARNLASSKPSMMCTINVDLTEKFQTQNVVIRRINGMIGKQTKTYHS